jgi:polyisoprenoid-binding protein YceI
MTHSLRRAVFNCIGGGTLVLVAIAVGPLPTMAKPDLAAMSNTAPAAIDYNSAADSGTASVSGTSTLHDWTVKGTTVSGAMQCSGPWTAAPPTIASIQLSIPADSLKSTEGSGMDDTMYDALNLKASPLITFALTHADLKSPPSKDDPTYHYDAVGQLTIAGTARAVNLTLDLAPGDGGTLTIVTETPLKMTDFGMKPPTAMMGMIKSGNDVTVKVTWRLATKAK